MKRSTMTVLIIALSVSATGLTGCSPALTAKITLNPKVPADLTERVPFSIGLSFTPEFLTYSRQEGPVGPPEMSSMMDYDLVSATKTLFIETFARMARGVVRVEGKPPYGNPDEAAAAIVIEPQIVGFGQEHPAYWIYTAYIEYRIIVYDRAGAILLDKVYRGDGDQGAKTYSPDSSYAAVAGIAMTRAIAALVKDVNRLPAAP